MSTEFCRCFASVSLSDIGYNIDRVREKIGTERFLFAVVKADAYGHGAVPVSKYLEERVNGFAVASIEEAAELRKAGIKKPVLILGYTSPSQYEEMLSLDVMTAMYSYREAELLSETACRMQKTAKIHIAVDTGMSRIGFRANKGSAQLIASICQLPSVAVSGIFSHFSCADMVEDGYSDGQYREFCDLLAELQKSGINIPYPHICNSAGIMRYDSRYFQCVRNGISTYGLYPSQEVDKSLLSLKPALEWKTHVIHIEELEPGRGVGYGATYMTDRPIRAAVLSVGYADGYPRMLSGKGKFLINGYEAPVIGRVCMDQTMVDISKIPHVAIEDEAVIIGKNKDRFISAEEFGDTCSSFNYEVVCRISKRVKRIYDIDV